MAYAPAHARPGQQAPDRRTLRPSSTVAEATLELLRRREPAAVVLEDGRPVGVITLVALCGQYGRTPAPQAPLADVMAFECVALDPAAGVTETLRTYTQAAWDSLRRRRPCAPETISRRELAFRGGPGPVLDLAGMERGAGASTWFG